MRIPCMAPPPLLSRSRYNRFPGPWREKFVWWNVAGSRSRSNTPRDELKNCLFCEEIVCIWPVKNVWRTVIIVCNDILLMFGLFDKKESLGQFRESSGIFKKTATVARLYNSAEKLYNSNFKNDVGFVYGYTCTIALIKNLMCVRSVK